MTGRTVIINPCGKTGEIVADSLRRHGLEVTVLTGPSARKDEPGFLRALHREADKGDVAAIIPIFFPEVLAAHRNEFPGIQIPVDDPKKILLLDNKSSACALAARLGIPQPRFYSTPDEISDYPVVFKRPMGQGGDSVYFPGNRRSLENLLKTESSPIIQEYIEGENVCVDALRCPDGEFYAAAYRVLEPRGKGVSTLRASSDEPELCALCKKILDGIDYKGVCGFDFRRSADGKNFFLEANPRFSGGLETTLASGLDLPWLLLSRYRSE